MNSTVKSDFSLCKSYCNKVQSSKDRDIGFELSLNNWINLSERKVSEYTGRPFDSSNDNRLSIERKFALDGYTVNNTIVCTAKENTIKSSLDAFIHSDIFTDEEKIKILRHQIYQLQKRVKS